MSANNIVQEQLVAAGGLDWAGGVPSLRASAKGFTATVVDNGAGDVTVNLPANAGVDPGDDIVSVVPNAAIFANAVYDRANSTATAKRFRVFDAAGAALDNIPLTIRIARLQTID